MAFNAAIVCRDKLAGKEQTSERSNFKVVWARSKSRHWLMDNESACIRCADDWPKSGRDISRPVNFPGGWQKSPTFCVPVDLRFFAIIELIAVLDSETYQDHWTSAFTVLMNVSLNCYVNEQLLAVYSSDNDMMNKMGVQPEDLPAMLLYDQQNMTKYRPSVGHQLTSSKIWLFVCSVLDGKLQVHSATHCETSCAALSGHISNSWVLVKLRPTACQLVTSNTSTSENSNSHLKLCRANCCGRLLV